MDSTDLQQAIQRIKAGVRQSLEGLIDRDAVAQLILLGAIAQEHLLIIGPPRHRQKLRRQARIRRHRRQLFRVSAGQVHRTL